MNLDSGDGAQDETFLAYARLLRRLAYDLTGSVHDADDAVQDAYLRWRRVDRSTVRDPRAYLVRTVTTAGLDLLRRRDREAYPGPWLVEPVPTGGADGIDADEVEFALLVVLHELSPRERAAFLLHHVFAFPHGDVARMLDSTPAAVRQLASRAARHLREHAPTASPRAAAEDRRVVDAFLVAVRTGDLAPITELLADDVRVVADGGGMARTARRPVVGHERVLRFLAGLAGTYVGRLDARPTELNHRPALLVDIDGRLDVALIVIADRAELGGHPVIREIAVVRNPEKIRHLRRPPLDDTGGCEGSPSGAR